MVEIEKGKETILVAEDDKVVRDLVKAVLEQHGYTVVEAVDGKDALEKFDEHKNIDLLILDSVMPVRNGREVYDAVSKINPSIKVIFTSGYTKDFILDKGIEDKRFDFLSKPLTPGDMLRKIREVLDRQ